MPIITLCVSKKWESIPLVFTNRHSHCILSCPTFLLLPIALFLVPSSHSQAYATFSLISRPLLPSVSFPDHYYLQSHSQTITTFSLIPRPLLPLVSFPDHYYLHSHSQFSILISRSIPRPPVSFPDLYYLHTTCTSPDPTLSQGETV